MRKKIKNSKIIYKVYDPEVKKSKNKKNNLNSNILDKIKKLIRTHKLTTLLLLGTTLSPLLILLPKHDKIVENNIKLPDTVTNTIEKNVTITNLISDTKHNTNVVDKEIINVPKSITVTNYIILLNNNSTNKSVKSYTIGASKAQPNFVDTDNQSFNYNYLIFPYVIERYLY